MSAYPKRLLEIENLSIQQAKEIIQLAISLKKNGFSAKPSNNIAVLAFFEPSTRTSMSFEIAAQRLGIRPIVFRPDALSSVVKGESIHESLETILAMQPDLVVVRHSGEAAVSQVLQNTSIAVVNAGDGKNEHPTQALLDAMTIVERHGHLEGQKVVFVGDVEHSRVARSNRALLTMFGAEVAVCAPDYLQPKSKDWASVKRFSTLAEATKWSTVCMGLRVQKERHSSLKFDATDYVKNFRLDKKNVAGLNRDALIMHPGPFVPEEDLSAEILSDPRCVIREQVANGVYVRMAVLGQMLEVFS